MAPIICIIDGNIGCGKSTLLDELKSRGYVTYPEPLDEWQAYLEMYYSDPHRWAFTTQIAIMFSFKKISKSIEHMDGIVFLERSPASGMIFTNVEYDLGFINDLEYELVYRQYVDYAIRSTYSIVLKLSAAECKNRIARRARNCEHDVTLDYLQKLESEYAKLENVTIIDACRPTKTIADDIEELIKNSRPIKDI